MTKRVLLIGTQQQIAELVNDPDFLAGVEQGGVIAVCTSAATLEQNITDSETPKDPATWNLPTQVFYTGQLRQTDPISGTAMTINDPNRIKELLEGYGLTPTRLDYQFSNR